MNESDSFRFDVRVRERLMARGIVTADEVAMHLSALTDREDACEALDLEQPALMSEEIPPEEPPMAGIVGLGVPALSPIDPAPPINPLDGGLGRHGLGGMGPAPKVSPFEPAPRVSALEPAPKVNPFESGPVSPYEPGPRNPYERGMGYPMGMPANPYESQMNPYAAPGGYPQMPMQGNMGQGGMPQPGMQHPGMQHSGMQHGGPQHGGPQQGMGGQPGAVGGVPALTPDGRYGQQMPPNPYYPQPQYGHQGYPPPGYGYGPPGGMGPGGYPQPQSGQHSAHHQSQQPGIPPVGSGSSLPSGGALGGLSGGMTSPMMNEPATSPMMPSQGGGPGSMGAGAPLVSPFEASGHQGMGHQQGMPHPGMSPQHDPYGRGYPPMPPQPTYPNPYGNPNYPPQAQVPGQGMPGQGMPGQAMPGQGMPGQGPSEAPRGINPFNPYDPTRPGIPAIDPLKPGKDGENR